MTLSVLMTWLLYNQQLDDVIGTNFKNLLFAFSQSEKSWRVPCNNKFINQMTCTCINREPSSFMVGYGYKNQRETLETYEDLYFGACVVWEKNELFFKGKVYKFYNICSIKRSCNNKYFARTFIAVSDYVKINWRKNLSTDGRLMK